MSRSSKTRHRVIPGSPTPSGVLTFSPVASGRVGETVTLSAWMTPNSPVTMQWFSGDITGVDVAFVTPCDTDSEGYFNCDFKVPALFFGSHQVIATDSQGLEVIGNFSIEPSITLSPATGPAASNVTINGSGWSWYDGIYVWLDNNESDEIPCYVTNGAFTCSMIVPAGTSNDFHTITARSVYLSSVTPDQSATFKVAPGPSITLAPASDFGGVSAQVGGAGFSPNTSLSLKFNGASIPFNSACQTDDTGSFANCPYTVPPSLQPNPYPVEVSDGTSNASATFDILSGASVSVTPNQVAPGSVLTVSGSNFESFRCLIVKLDDAVEVDWMGNPCFSNANGEIPAYSYITLYPGIKSGGHKISVSDGSKVGSATFTVTNGRGRHK